MSATPSHARLAVIGGGPAGLMAAEVAHAAGFEVDVFEAKGSVGRKFLIAGKGGMNLTHGEPKADFVQRYGARAREIGTWLEDFDADDLRAWARGLGVDTFVGSSGRVFPSDLKAAPLLRAWVHRLRESGVRFHVHHRWLGWHGDGSLRMATPDGEHALHADAAVLALGGGSWPQLGSDGAWQPWLAGRGVAVAPLAPSNSGFDIGWSEHLSGRFAGAPLKPVVLHWRDPAGREHTRQGECVITATGIEGSLIYAFSGPLREAIAAHGAATIALDLSPGRSLERLRADLARPRGSRSIGDHLRRQAGIDGIKAALLHECLARESFRDADALARAIKRLPLRLVRARPIEEAISSAGGVRLEALGEDLMLQALPGVFCAGEMLDWEAPTGGYLLTACFASGRRAGQGAAAWLRGRAPALHG
ncbi:TIGR03862 family flavoprotein [Dyella sedimenti]|uniref:TIGR03862 family flavoprotein n=1 Tax=Dyella sedimenti TaxID=2919947 RepID=UPI001FA9EE2D|nr:TIGR03862 family flavoprotein [Dyella sedimenti]